MLKRMTGIDQNSVAAICDRLGRKEMAQALQVRATAISNAVRENTFPSKWYLVVRQMCAAAGIECPDELFAFSKPNAGDAAAQKGAA